MKLLPGRIVLFVLFTFFTGLMQAQVKPGTRIPGDTLKKQIINVDFADVFEYLVRGKDTYQKLLGDVELRQDSIYMYCDSAIIRNDVYVTATGNVLIQQGDSISVFADSALYNGAVKLADLYGNVILLNNNQRLFTDSLHYDMNTKVATYSSGATLTNDTTRLSSLKGYYYVNSKEIYFKEKVVVVNPDFNLNADTLKFNTESRMVTFLGPTIINTKENGKIYCEGGFYDIRNKLAEFHKNAQYVNGDRKATASVIRYDGNAQEYTLDGEAYFEDGKKKATADVIRYNEVTDKSILEGNAHYFDGKQDITADRIVYDGRSETYSTRGRSRVSDPPQILEADSIDFDNETGLGIAAGDVIWQDTSRKLSILTDQADYNKKDDYLKTKGGRPWLISIMEGDSLFLRSDTLVSFAQVDSITGDTNRTLLAYHDVRIYKSNLQAVCDSLHYGTEDSLFHFFDDPVIWSDTTQFISDTIRMQMADNKIDRIFLRQNAFIINSPDEIFFNQVKGKDITAYFMESELRRMLVEGNAESVYYALDDKKAYIGVNKTICSEMLLFFGANQVEEIKFFAEPKATLYPMQQAEHNALKMEGFNWIIDKRPSSKNDL